MEPWLMCRKKPDEERNAKSGGNLMNQISLAMTQRVYQKDKAKDIEMIW